MNETWTTATIPVETPRGVRYVGVAYVGLGRPHQLQRRPKAVRYATRLRRFAYLAAEQARSRTIHHNLFHDGSEWAASAEARTLHSRYGCPER